jgi:hypothetical protein
MGKAISMSSRLAVCSHMRFSGIGRVPGVTVDVHYVAESIFRATLSIFGMGGRLNEALRIINCLRALARVFMVQQNEADVPEMLAESGKWLDGDTLLSKGAPETPHKMSSGCQLALLPSAAFSARPLCLPAT